MKIVSWNINGLRSVKSRINVIINDLDADILCLQETKLSRSLLEESLAFIDGYNSYFAFPRHLTGYSGVATYCKDSCKPISVKEGLSNVFDPNFKSCLQTDLFPSSELAYLDREGRVLMTEHLIKIGNKEEKLMVINVYCPRADPNKEDRKEFKLKFNQLLQHKTKTLIQDYYQILIVGDINIAHKTIDHCDPGNEDDFLKESSRQWLNSFIVSTDTEMKSKNDVLIDTFRFLHPTKKESYTCWNSKTNARITNYGTRIDYILVNKKLLPHLKESVLLSDIKGSDHCPVLAKFDFSILSNKQCPPLCTQYWPEFAGKQQKLLGFLQNTYKNQLKEESLQNNKKQKIDKQKSITQFLLKTSKKETAGYIDDKLSSSNQTLNEDLETCKFKTLKQELNSQINCNTENFINIKRTKTIQSDFKNEGLNNKQKEIWKNILRGPPELPLCTGHREPCVLRTVKKEGPNYRRQFFTCARPIGHSTNPEARCNYFKWVTSFNK